MTSEVPEGSQQLVDLALQLGRAAYGDTPHDGMTPAQWAALRYFSRANRFSRTVSAFARFHATTRGTASQTIKSLVTRGLLQGTRSERDGRSTRFDLTGESRRLLARDPLDRVLRAAGELPAESRSTTVLALRQLLETLARERAEPLPGRCALCGHLGTAKAGGWQCGLMQEELAKEELRQLCIRFSPAPGGG